MSLINIDIFKPKTSFQITVSLDSTFSDVSELVFEKFNLKKSDFPDSKEYAIKFIYKSKICQNNKTLSSYEITPESRITVYLPNALSSIVSAQNGIPTKKEIDQNVNNSNNNDSNKNDSNNNDSNKNDSNNNDSNEQKVNPKTTVKIEDITSFPKPLQKADDPSIHPIIKRLADKNILQELVNLEFDETDAAYSLVYRKDIDSCIDLITSGIASDPEYRYHINEIASGRASQTESVLHEIEIAKIESNKKGENEQIAIGAVLSEAAVANRIEDDSVNIELKKKYDQLNMLYKNEIMEKVQDDMARGKQIIFYDPRTHIPQLCDFGQLFQYLSDQHRKMQNYYQSIYDPNMYNTPLHQAANVYDEEVMNKQAIIQSIHSQFQTIFNNIPSMTPENYVNPFTAVYDEMSKYSSGSTISLYGYAKNMDYNQLKYLYRMVYEKKVEMNEAIQYLMISEGNVEAAEQLASSAY